MGKIDIKRLTWWGTLLFMLGLLTGLMLAMMPGVVNNPRGVLAGHLEGVMNGMFLIIVGLMADRIRLSTRASSICVGLLLYSRRWPSCLTCRRAGDPDRRGERGVRDDWGRRDVAVWTSSRRMTDLHGRGVVEYQWRGCASTLPDQAPAA